MGAGIALLACAVVVAMLVLRVAITDLIQRRLDGRCLGRCGKDGWILLRDDGVAIHRRCIRCGWLNRFDRKREFFE
jgi:hypothetical protein